MKKIGLTTTVPIEILIAAGYTPVDLNNLFITSKNYLDYIDIAEKDGFPRSFCAWIKGIYGACIYNDITEIVGVLEGDCSNTKSLVEVLKLKGIKIYPFSFPITHKKEDVKKEILKFMNLFNVTLDEVENIRKELNSIRNLAKKLDYLTYKSNKCSGFENHLYQVSLSDFNGNTSIYKSTLINTINSIEKRNSCPPKIRLGYLGVPPMIGDIYDFVNKFNAQFVYNEVQREFAFPRANDALTIFDQYYDYTYPYDIEFRLEDIKKQIKERKIDALIHYTQAFCHRSLDDIVLKQNLDIPILNIEGDKQNSLDARTKLRLEAFLDMLIDLKEAKI